MNESPTPDRSAYFTLAVLALSMLLASLGTSIANVALPAIAADLETSFQGVQWVVLSYLLAVTVLVVSAGRVSDALGGKKLLIGGLIIFASASFLCGLAPSLPFLIGARTLQGLGASVLMALSVAFAGEGLGKEKTGSVMGLLGAMSAVGTALGPSIGGLLISYFGWRYVFFVKVPVAILAVALALAKLPSLERSSNRAPRSIDVPGTLILVFALSTYALAMTTGKGQVGSINVVLLLASVAGFVFFVLAAKTSESPLVDLSLFREPGLAAGLVTSALVSTVLMATLIVGPFYLIGSLHLEVSSVGMVMAAGPATVALSGIPIGRIVDRIGAGYIAFAGLTAIGSGTALLAMGGTSLGLAGYLSATVILTLGYAAFQTANNTGVMRIAGADRKGVVSGMLNLSRNIGLITGSSLMGAVFAYASGSNLVRNPGPAAISYGMRFTFAFATLLIAGALAIAIKAYRTDGSALSRVPAST